jgi:inhibitor of KinA sporulation pathway (predicted exonuclease)
VPRKPYLLDVLVVVDLEASCWKRKPPKDQHSEIIEIGVCTLDIQTGERQEKESILVKPVHSKISKFCTSLTTLTQEQVDKGVSFDKACAYIRDKYNTQFRTWASYGDYDRVMFHKQCKDFGVEYPFGDRHINVKNIFALVHGLQKEVGMKRALEMRQIEMQGTHHRGHDDAWNTAALLAELLLLRRQSQP